MNTATESGAMQRNAQNQTKPIHKQLFFQPKYKSPKLIIQLYMQNISAKYVT